MAKRKPPAALFEVIHTAPPPPLNIPKRTWWFGYRSQTAQPQSMRALHPAMIPDEPHRPTLPAKSSCSPEAELRARFADVESAHEVAVFSADEPEGLIMEDSPRLTAHGAPSDPTGVAGSPSTQVSEFCAGGVRIDRGRQEVTFRLRYTTAALLAFIALVLMGLAFVVGKRLPDHSADDQAMAALRNSQPNPAVLSVDRADESAGNSAVGAGSHAQLPAHPAAAAAGAPAAGTADRTIGLDYLVVQSYPDRKSAQEAADMLTSGEVPCTVEHGLRWAPNWFSVVTVAGYPPHDTDERDRLANAIRKIASKQSASGHHYHFEPLGYQWNQ